MENLYSSMLMAKKKLTRPAAVKQVLNGTISEKGILAPMSSSINNPLMKELKEQYGLVSSSTCFFKHIH
jgi:hypothetical protein